MAKPLTRCGPSPGKEKGDVVLCAVASKLSETDAPFLFFRLLLLVLEFLVMFEFCLHFNFGDFPESKFLSKFTLYLQIISTALGRFFLFLAVLFASTTFIFRFKKKVRVFAKAACFGETLFWYRHSSFGYLSLINTKPTSFSRFFLHLFFLIMAIL